VKPGSQKQLYGELDSFELTGIEPPLWAALLGGYLRGLGYSVVLLDEEVEQWTHVQTAAAIRDIDPRLAVISVSGTNPSASTMNMTGASEIVKHLHQVAPHIRTLLQGLHPSALPERSLQETTTDFVCQGEGFFTLPGLIDALRAGDASFTIEGLWYREDGAIRSHPSPPLFGDLDQLPMPAWDLLPMARYRAHNWHCMHDIESRQPYGILYTSLGCPFRCTFCCINAIFGKPGIRFRSPGKIAEEIDFLVQTYGIRNIKIIDELFAVNEKRVVDICDRIIELGHDLNMWAYARVNTVTPLMLRKMKQAGINWVAYGFESGSKRVLEGVKKSYRLDAVDKVVRATYDEGLYIGANYIFGLPDDDFDSMQETLDLAHEINAEWANLYVTMAYPGSKLHEEALARGWSLPDTWSGFSQYAYESLPLPTKHLTPGEVLAFRDYAFQAYYDSPRYLDKIRRLFGMRAVGHIREMTGYRLERKHTQFTTTVVGRSHDQHPVQRETSCN